MNKAKDKIDRLHLYTRVCNQKSSKTYYIGKIDNVEILKHPLSSKSLKAKKQSFCVKAKEDLVNQNLSGFENDLLEMCSEETPLRRIFQNDWKKLAFQSKGKIWRV